MSAITNIVFDLVQLLLREVKKKNLLDKQGIIPIPEA